MLATGFTRLPEPFGTMAREMDRAFEEFTDQAVVTRPQAPVALWDDDQAVSLEVEVPGIRQEDLELTVRDGRLLIAGERKAPQRSGKCWFNEHKYGRFERLIALSDMIDTNSIEAALENGVLYVTLHKRPEAQPHRITINSRDSSEQPRLTAEEAPSQA